MAIQGIYILAGAGKGESGPAIAVEGFGPLCSRARDADVEIVFEGVLTGGRRESCEDAEIALEAWRNGGLAGLRDLDGFFSVAAVERDRVTLVCDPMATRPQWIYRGERVAASAPTPVYFAEQGLAMSFDRLGFYQSLRLMHGVGKRTLVREVSRNRPLTAYVFHRDGRLEEDERFPVRQELDESRTLEQATDEIRDLLADVMTGLLSHPKLRARQLHLPLTAGMDSRHILAQLRKMDRAPASLRHVYVHAPEADPVKAMAAGLGHPLHLVDVGDLDYDVLHPHWLHTTAGLVHHHQIYLMGVAPTPSEVARTSSGFLGFDGYLADKLVGFACRHVLLDGRFYARASLPLLFGDSRDLERSTLEEIAAEYARWDGDSMFKNGGTDAFNRGPTYTGGIYPTISGLPGAGDVQYFAPTAHARAFEFFRTTPYSIAGKKRARLNLFRRDFPVEGAYPAEDGLSYVERDRLEQPGGGGGIPWTRVRDYVRGVATGFRDDPAPDTEHAWVRKMPYWHESTRHAVHDSKLASEGLVHPRAMRGLWRTQQLGGFAAWTLMGLVSGEVAYRTLVLREPADDVAAWLWPRSRRA